MIWLGYIPTRLLVMLECPTVEITAMRSRIIPQMKCSPAAPFDTATRSIPPSDTMIPRMFSGVIFSLKKRMPAPVEKIGIVAITTALIVGEPVSLMPKVSHIKYMNGSKNARRRNFGRSRFWILLIRP